MTSSLAVRSPPFVPLFFAIWIPPFPLPLSLHPPRPRTVLSGERSNIVATMYSLAHQASMFRLQLQGRRPRFCFGYRRSRGDFHPSDAHLIWFQELAPSQGTSLCSFRSCPVADPTDHKGLCLHLATPHAMSEWTSSGNVHVCVRFRVEGGILVVSSCHRSLSIKPCKSTTAPGVFRIEVVRVRKVLICLDSH